MTGRGWCCNTVAVHISQSSSTDNRHYLCFIRSNLRIQTAKCKQDFSLLALLITVNPLTCDGRMWTECSGVSCKDVNGGIRK